MPDNPIKRFIGDIHRRSLWQVLGIYLLGSWLVYQVVQSLTEGLGLPDWFPAFAVVFLLLGLPMVLATAFVQEGRPAHEEDGVPADDVDRAPADPTTPSLLFTWRNAFLGGVGAFAIVGMIAVGSIIRGGGVGGATSAAGGPTSVERSIAVLPFDDLSPEGDQQYFAEGLSEGILHALAQFPDLKVAARTSAFLLAEQGADIETVARTLGVATVMEGSIQRAGDQIRITAQLIEAETSFHLWSEVFDRPFTDIFGIQDEIARAIVDRLQVTLAGGAPTELVAEATSSTEAHEAYLRGRFFWNQRTEESLGTAITEFQRAIDLDPNYSEAHAGLSDAYLLLDHYTLAPGRLDFRTNLERGLIAARRAVSLAPDLNIAHASLAFGLWNVGDWDGAEEEFERAIELNSGYATAHHWYALFSSTTGRELEGVAHARRAMELDPVSRVISRNLARTMWVAGQTEEAIEQMRETVQLTPGWSSASFELAAALLEIEEYDEGLKVWVDFARLAGVDAQAGREAYEAAVRYRETGEPQTLPDLEVNLRTLIWVNVQSGQFDRAIELLEDYVETGAYGWAAYSHVLWTGDRLGGDPRYPALIEKAGITW